MLSVAQDIVSQLTPHQNALSTALDVATSLPLVGDQLNDVQEFNTILQDALASLEAQTQNLTSGHFQLAVPLPSFSETFTFDLGLDAFLQVTTAGGVSASINPVLNVGFDYQNGVVSLDTANTGLDIGFNLALPNFQATMSFNGLLFTKAVDQGTSFQGNLGFNFNSGGGITADFSGEAHVRLGLTMSFVDPALDADFNPTFRSNLEMDWGFNTANNELLAPSIRLNDFSLEADSFLQGFMGDIVSTVQKVTKPIQPFIDIFDTPVPILSAFDSSQTVGDLFLKGSGLSQEQQDSFNFMVEVIRVVNAIDLGSTGGALITFGDINLTGDARHAGGFNFDTSQITNVIDDIFNAPGLDELQETMEAVANYAGATSSAGFKFNLLENPGPVIGAILTGGTESIFSYSTGRQHFDLGASIGVGIEDIFGIFLAAGIVFDANLTMGYDTAGLVKVAQTGDIEDLLHGFYFDNSVDTSGPPVPNVPDPRKTGLYVQGFMELKASAIVTISGGLYANLSVELASTDSSSHVHLDSMIQNLASGSKVFDLGGQIYAAATIELTLPNPIGPDITIFEYELVRETLVDFDPPPSPSLGRPLTIVDVTDQHTLLLDVNKMQPRSVVKVQPFHDYVAAGTTYAGDGIRVDYANEIVLYVMRKDDVTTNYYNLIGVNGAIPDGVSIDIVDPFGVFAKEGATNPAPSQTTPGVLLAGGKNVGYAYTEAPNGSHATVLLAGGYGSNTLTGGTMTFGNFIPAGRIAQAKAHFGNTSGYDGAGQSLINSVIDAAIAPVNPAGIIGARMNGSRGGLMLGGPGVNSFAASGPGAYEMIGGAWVDSFYIAPSFKGVPATYYIDGGPGGGNSLAVRVPGDENVTFENSTLVDIHNPTFKALAVQANAGLSATAHGIKKVQIIAEGGSYVTIGDTSELDIAFTISGGADLTFGGTNAPDVFDVTTTGAFHSQANHYGPPRLSMYNGVIGAFPWQPNIRWPDPVYTVTRTFGTNGRTQVVPFTVSDVYQSSLALNAGGASDAYSLTLGLGAFLDIGINDSDASTVNSLAVNVLDSVLENKSLTISDNAVELDYYTNAAYFSSTLNPGQYLFFSSVHYTPTVSFTNNFSLAVTTAFAFLETTINRPTSTQATSFSISELYTTSPLTYGAVSSIIGIYDATTLPPTHIHTQNLPRTLNVLANAGSLAVHRSNLLSFSGVQFNIHSNTGTLSFTETQKWSGYYDTFNILGNAGTLNVNTTVNSSYGGSYVQGLTRVVNVLANAGTINLHSVVESYLINYGLESQVNVGNNGSLANLRGTINLSNFNGHYGLKIDDRSGTASRPWTIDYTRTQVGDVTVNYPGVNLPAPYADIFSRYEAYPQTGSAITVVSEPPFYIRQLNGGSFPNWQFYAPYYVSQRDGDNVNVDTSISGDPGGAVTYAATGLPPGLSINPTTGVISGIIPEQSHRLEPYVADVRATAGGITRSRLMTWSITSGIEIFWPETEQGYREGEVMSYGPFTTTNTFNRPVTLSATGLPPGLMFDANTATVNGAIAIGSAQNGPYHVTINATDGLETAVFEFDWYVTGITLATPAIQLDFVGESVSVAVHGFTASGAPLVYTAEDLPDGLSIDASTGVISGVLDAVAAESRTFYPRITATNGNDLAEVYFSWVVLPAGVSNHISIADPGLQNSREGDYGYIQIYSAINSLYLPLTYTVTGLPPGLELSLGGGDVSGSYFIRGYVPSGAASALPYHVEIVAADGIWSDTLAFDWVVRPPGTVDVQGYQSTSSFVNDTIEFGVYAESSLAETLTFSATGLPPGLSINSETGVISGTVLPQAAIPSVFQTSITATSASDSDTSSFLWTILSSYQEYYQPNVITLPSPTGVGTFDITSPEGTVLTASISPNAGVTLPNSVTFPYGFLTFTISNLAPGAAADVIISGFDVTDITDYYRYGETPANPTEHWYNFLFGVGTDGDSAIGTGMEIVGDTLVLHFVDGGRGDDDLAMNGVIFDIGGPALIATVPPPALPGDYNLDNRVDAGDYVVWRKTQTATGLTPYSGADGNGDGHIGPEDYNVWRAHFGQSLPPGGGGAAATSSSVSQLSVVQSAFRTEVLRQEASPASSLSQNDPPVLVDDQPSNTKSRAFAVDFDLGSLLPNHYVGTTSGAGSRMATPIASDATRRDQLLALCQANWATDEGFTVPTAFDDDWHTDHANSDDVDHLDIHAIDDAFEELRMVWL